MCVFFGAVFWRFLLGGGVCLMVWGLGYVCLLCDVVCFAGLGTPTTAGWLLKPSLRR